MTIWLALVGRVAAAGVRISGGFGAPRVNLSAMRQATRARIYDAGQDMLGDQRAGHRLDAVLDLFPGF